MADNDSQASTERLRQQIAKLQEKLKKKQAAEAAKARKDDTRRKIIVGALALNHMEKNPDSAFTKTLRPLLDEYVLRPEERQLLNLPPRSGTAANDTKGEGALKSDFPKASA